jgi:hypothetical protein
VIGHPVDAYASGVTGPAGVFPAGSGRLTAGEDEIRRRAVRRNRTADLRARVRADALELERARGFALEVVERLREDLRAARAAGATLGELAADAGLSSQRVAQITQRP